MATLIRSTLPRMSLAVLLLLGTMAAYGVVSLPSLIARWGISAPGLGVLFLWGMFAAAICHVARKSPAWGDYLPILVGIAMLRIAFGGISLDRVSPGDPHAYLVIAQQLIDGRGYYFDEPFMGLRTRAFFPPGYPIVLAGWGAVFGLSTWSVLALATLIDMAAAIVIARIGARLDSAAAGRAAALLYLVWPSVLFDAPLAAKEGLCTLLVLVIAQQWIDVARGAAIGWRRVAALGVAAGWLTLTQPGLSAVAALFGMALVGPIGWRRMMRLGVPAAAIALAVLMPWWVRNWLVFGAFVPLTSAGGLSLWIGNNPDATGAWMPPPPSLRGLPELEYSRRAAAMAYDWMLAHPVDAARLTLAKLLRATGVAQFGLVRLAAMYPPISHMLAAMLLPLAQGSHVLMMATGAAAARAGRSGAVSILVLLVAACLAQLLLFGMWFEFGERHRTFLTPFLLLLSASVAADWRGWPVLRYRSVAA